VRIVVEVRGCFWHGCPDHSTQPKHNAEWWSAKIASNRTRDADSADRLRLAGWLLVEVWEHEDMKSAARRISDLVHGSHVLHHRQPDLGHQVRGPTSQRNDSNLQGGGR
jgi:DNA mismatch endonuclease (patch repair protein)